MPNQAARGFARFDRNQDHRLVPAEVPEILQARFESLNERMGKPKNFPIIESEWRQSLEAPQSLIGWSVLAIRELSFGFILGLGISIVFSGLQFAGEMIDQQTGIGLSGVFNPGFDMNSGVSGQASICWGLWCSLRCLPCPGIC